MNIEKVFHCPICKFECKTKRALHTHYGQKHKEYLKDLKLKAKQEKEKDWNVYCPCCNEKFKDLRGLVTHAAKIHKSKAEDIILQVKYNNEPVLCKCGCGERTSYTKGDFTFREYVKGHIARINNNYQTEKSINNSRKTKAERAASGIYKGIFKSEEHKEKIRQKSLLFRHSDETKTQMSKDKLEWWKNNPEKANYYQNEFWKEYWKVPEHRFMQGVKRNSSFTLEDYKLKKELEESKKDFVYLIGTEGRDCYKIGFTTHTPYDRLLVLQQSTPDRLILVSWFETNYKSKLEKCLHEKFKENRVIKEWFRLTQGDVKNFRNTCESFEKVLGN